ncbi:hypothetical protein niasHT_031469 [Heterodera trifolii]|uniref:Uncharacterized protein n=1 Tax=Heterodera trifolii TaxID=157864 RepID=A0ABD2ISJ9_9BILA
MGSNFELSWAKLGTSDRQYVIVHLHDGRKYRFRVPKGSFLSPQQLERGIHHGMIAEVERLLTRKRSAPVHASFGNGDDDEEEGEILDVSFVEEEGEDTGEAPLNPLSNLTKQSAEQQLRHEKWAQEERRRREEEQRKQREAERKRREEEERRRKTEEDKRKAAEKTAKEKKVKEEKEASEKKASEEKLAKEKKEEQRIAKEKKGEKEAKDKKAEEERVEKERKAEEERVAKAEEERVAKAEEERVAKAEEERLAISEAERVAKAEAERVAKEREAEEEERVANETKKKQEEKQTAELQRQQLATRKQKELELLKEFRPWRGGYMRLVHGKDPTPDVHYLHETDDYHFVNAVHKYRVRHSELPWEAPEFNPSAHIQQNIGEFRELFEQEVYDENYAVKTREEKEELIELVKGFRVYFTEQIGRFELKVFNGKISHITLTDQLA